MSESILLRGLDGANPLAFLAALGTLRVLTLASHDSKQPRMAWRVERGGWRPLLTDTPAADERKLSELVFYACKRFEPAEHLPKSDDLNVSAQDYRAYAEFAADAASRGEFTPAEFAAALACDAIVNGDGTVQDTALRTMSGAGHQHFLRIMRNLIAQTSESHLYKVLFASWRYDDPVRNMTLRWDPSDDSRYALRWSDPSGDRERQYRGAMWGANRLAIEGLPLLPVMPTLRQLKTVGFRTAGARGTFWTWPIWETPIALDSLRSLLALNELQSDPPPREILRARGIIEIFRSQRLTVGKFRNFTWGMPA